MFFCKASHQGEDKSLTSLLEVNACPVDSPVGDNTLCLARRASCLANVLYLLGREHGVLAVSHSTHDVVLLKVLSTSSVSSLYSRLLSSCATVTGSTIW